MQQEQELPPQQQQRHHTSYWIPKDVYLPSPSRSSITTSGGVSNNQLNLVECDDANDSGSPQTSIEEDASSVWSLSTTSELTFHSLGRLPGPTAKMQVAVESMYKEMENDFSGPLFLQNDELERLNAFPVIAGPLNLVEHDGNNVGCEENDLVFDPFHVQTEAEDCTSSFTEFYTNGSDCNVNINLDEHVASDAQEETLLINPSASTATEHLPGEGPWNTNSCAPIDKYQRRHSFLGITAARPKRRVLVPLHARMEILSHHTQKPFRTVSRMFVSSFSRLHNRMSHSKPASPKAASSSPRNRFEIFRRNSEMLVTDGYQFEEEESSVTSLPDLRNIDSSETEGTAAQLEVKQSTSWDKEEAMIDEKRKEGGERSIAQFVVDEERRAKMEEVEVAQFMIDVEPTAKVEPAYAAQLLEDEEERAKVAADPSNEENDDLRWLFARQQLPASAAV